MFFVRNMSVFPIDYTHWCIPTRKNEHILSSYYHFYCKSCPLALPQGVVPTAPEKPAEEGENRVEAPDPRPDNPPNYMSHCVQAVPPPASCPGGLPMRFYSPQQPSTFPLYQPTSGIDPIQYQPGKHPMPNQSAPITWMPGPTLMPNCPPGLECLAQVLHINPNYFLVKCDWSDKKRQKAR